MLTTIFVAQTKGGAVIAASSRKVGRSRAYGTNLDSSHLHRKRAFKFLNIFQEKENLSEYLQKLCPDESPAKQTNSKTTGHKIAQKWFP